jgi:O-antigen/teichoic acid export membrane protein
VLPAIQPQIWIGSCFVGAGYDVVGSLMAETQTTTKPIPTGGLAEQHDEAAPQIFDGAIEAPAEGVVDQLLSRMGRGASVMVVLTLLASATNYASNLIFSRVLSPASYGDLTALLALLVVLTVPTGAAQTVIAERVASHLLNRRIDRVRYLIRHALAHVSVVAIAVGVVYTLSIPLIVDLLDLQAIGPAIALAPLVTLSFLVPIVLGTLQGMDRYLAFGSMLLAIAVSRIAFGVPWAATASGGSGGAIAGQALGVGVVLLGAAWILRSDLIGRGTGAATSGLRRRPDVRAVTASVAFIAFAVISNLDILLAKLFLPADDVGLYAALSTIGKIVMFLPAAIAVVMVPNAARARHSRRDAGRVLRIAAILVALTTVIAAVPAALAPEIVIRAMFGSNYLDATNGVLPMVCAGAGLALLYLLVVYSVAIEDRRWSMLLGAGIALQITGISLFHSSPAQVALVQAVVIGIVLLGNELGFHRLLMTPRTTTREQAGT